MIPYTSPTEQYSVNGIDLSSAEIYVTYRQKNKHGKTVIKTFRPTNVEYDGEATTFEVELSQADTADFEVGEAELQINYLLDGKRAPTFVKTIYVGTQLLEKELP